MSGSSTGVAPTGPTDSTLMTLVVVVKPSMFSVVTVRPALLVRAGSERRVALLSGVPSEAKVSVPSALSRCPGIGQHQPPAGDVNRGVGSRHDAIGLDRAIGEVERAGVPPVPPTYAQIQIAPHPQRGADAGCSVGGYVHRAHPGLGDVGRLISQVERRYYRTGPRQTSACPLLVPVPVVSLAPRPTYMVLTAH